MGENIKLGPVLPNINTVHDTLNYLSLAEMQKNPDEFLAQRLDTLVQQFTTLPTLYQEDPVLADTLATKLERGITIVAISKGHYTLEPETIENLYTTTLKAPFTECENKDFIYGLDVFDKRNQKQGKTPVHIADRYRQTVVNGLIHPKNAQDFKNAELIVKWSWPFLTGLRETLAEAISQTSDDDTIRKVFPLFANRYGLENIQLFLKNYAESHEDFQPILVHANNVLGFDQSQILPTMNNTYDAIQESFIKYKPNEELLPHETSLLKKTFGPDAHILDIGFGPEARHMNALQQAGWKHVTGIDVVSSNVSRALKDNPTLDISIGDWHDLKFADASFDGVYCLGRSILHNTTLDDWLQTLREMHRTLKPSSSKVLIDIPEVSEGSYQQETKKFSNKAHSLDIHEYEFGSIHDSADHQHFLDRFVPSINTFEIMAKVCGFDTKIVSKKPYGNDGDVNIYWELTPNGQPMTYQQYMSLYGRELTNKPIITIDVSRRGY